ncbi:MAG: RnfH family protein [Pseudomonadota bacterium]
MIRVRVVRVLPERHDEIELEVRAGTTLRQAVEKSGFGGQPPLRLGVFGRARKPDEPVKEGDRIEVYRELLIDPKDARRRRAAKKS